MAGIDDVNRHPVIHTWSYKLAEVSRYDSNHGNADLVGPLGHRSCYSNAENDRALRTQPFLA